MQVKTLRIQHFRGFKDLTITPNGHVVMMGEPGSGRSDVIEALRRVLDADALRTRTTSELDFHMKDTSQPIQVSVTLGELGTDLEQDFLDHLELWDTQRRLVIEELESPEMIDNDANEWVLRLSYQAIWHPEEELCEESVFYQKDSDPVSRWFVRTRRADLQRLGAIFLYRRDARILSLAPRSQFRRVLQASDGNDFQKGTQAYLEEVTVAAENFGMSDQVQDALDTVIEPLRALLKIRKTEVSDLLRFSPVDGSASGLLRSLGPDLDLQDDVGSLPMWRQGSTAVSLVELAEAYAMSQQDGLIIAVDDLGDRLDPASATHMAATIMKSTGQVWVSTRTPAVAEVFAPHEIVRLGRSVDGGRFVRQGRRAESQADISMSKFWHRTLVPALSYRSVVVVEGSGDFAALHNLGARLSTEFGMNLPATSGVAIVSAGAVGGGGYAMVLKLSKAARAIGLRAIAALDGDTTEAPRKYMQDHNGWADAIVRLPDSVAIEAALVRDLPPNILRETIRDIAQGIDISLPYNLAPSTCSRLRSICIQFIKNNSLHGLFINALPAEHLPQLAVRYYKTLIKVASGDQSGLLQL